MAKYIYEKWSLKWDFKEEGEKTTTRMDRQRMVRIGDLSYSGSTGNPTPYKDVYFQNSKPVGEIETFYYPTGSRAYGTNVQHVIKYASKSFDWLANQRGPDAFIETAEAVDGTYPDDGVQDGFYYIKIKPAFPAMRILRNGQWVEVETGYVLKDGIWKPIEEIYKLQNGQWVQA